MAKRSRRALSKKGLKGLIRFTDNDGKRKWLYHGQKFPTLRGVVIMRTLEQLNLNAIQNDEEAKG